MRTVWFLLPSDTFAFRPVNGAGTWAHKISPAQSRMSLASRYSFPKRQAQQDVRALVNLCSANGFPVPPLQTLANKFLAKRQAQPRSNIGVLPALRVEVPRQEGLRAELLMFSSSRKATASFSFFVLFKCASQMWPSRPMNWLGMNVLCALLAYLKHAVSAGAAGMLFASYCCYGQIAAERS